jgi:hypothetical protein
MMETERAIAVNLSQQKAAIIVWFCVKKIANAI